MARLVEAIGKNAPYKVGDENGTGVDNWGLGLGWPRTVQQNKRLVPRLVMKYCIRFTMAESVVFARFYDAKSGHNLDVVHHRREGTA